MRNGSEQKERLQWKGQIKMVGTEEVRFLCEREKTLGCKEMRKLGLKGHIGYATLSVVLDFFFFIFYFIFFFFSPPERANYCAE